MNQHIYCVFCGELNDKNNKRCQKCHRILDPKEHALLDYFQSKISDKYIGDVKDNLFSILYHFIKSNLYGITLSCSIIISAISVVANISSNINRYEKVEEKPVIQKKITYQGTGLNPYEVTTAYVNAIQNNDLDKVKSLQLNSFYPEISSELSNQEFTNDTYIFNTVKKIDENTFLENRDKYLKDNLELRIFESTELMIPTGTYKNYSFYRYVVWMNYCYQNKCRIIDEKEVSDFSARVVVELIEIDGNYYVSGEEVAHYRDTLEETMYHLLIKYDGDTSKLVPDIYNHYLVECAESADIKSCVYN